MHIGKTEGVPIAKGINREPSGVGEERHLRMFYSEME